MLNRSLITHLAVHAGDNLPLLHDEYVLAGFGTEDHTCSLIVDGWNIHRVVEVFLTQLASLERDNVKRESRCQQPVS